MSKTTDGNTADGTALLPFIMAGRAGDPTYDDDSLADYHPPRNADERREYWTESVLARDSRGLYVKLLLTGRWSPPARQIVGPLRFTLENERTLLAIPPVYDPNPIVSPWQLAEYRLALPEPDKLADVLMVGRLSWKQDGRKPIETSWIWREV
jgi:hypothetical protein